jgi:DNA-binding ferritin-like protein
MKLRIREDFDSTTSIGTEYNPVSVFDAVDDISLNESNFYEDLEALGFVFTLAANDIHTIHVNACGENFKELHLSADELYKILGDYADTAFEICCEDGHYIHNINDAANMIDWEVANVGERGFDIYAGTQAIVDILHNVTIAISELYNDCPSDIQSTLDEWLRELNSKMNYFLGRVVQCKQDSQIATESMMLKNTRHDRRKSICEHLENLKLGQSYVQFCQVEDHIEDYNCDTTTLKEGDYIIRDFQFGHLPNGGNKGYIPYKVIDIEYDRDEDVGGYWDARKRLHLFDGYNDFYIECYNERFNGMFHKLFKKSVVEE